MPEQPGAAALRILVVDDNEDSAEMLAEALKAKGYQTRASRTMHRPRWESPKRSRRTWPSSTSACR